MPVDCPRNDLFARTAFAANQHIDILVRDASDRLVNFLHGRARPDQSVGRAFAVRGSRGRVQGIGGGGLCAVKSPMTSACRTTSRILAMSNGLRKIRWRRAGSILWSRRWIRRP